MDIKIKRWLMVIFAIILNSFSNALLAFANLGNTYWGVAALNIEQYTGLRFGTSLLIIMLGLFILNRILLKEYRPILDTVSLVVTILQGSLINVFIVFLENNIDYNNSYLLQNFIWLLGFLLMTVSISMYLKPNLITPALDENMGVFARLYFKGNFIKSGYLCMSIAMVIVLVFGILNNMNFYGFNIHSLIMIFTLGYFTDFFFKNMKIYDKFIEFRDYKPKIKDNMNLQEILFDNKA